MAAGFFDAYRRILGWWSSVANSVYSTQEFIIHDVSDFTVTDCSEFIVNDVSAFTVGEH